MSEPTVTHAREPDHPTATVAGGGSGTAEGDTPSPPGYELHALIGSGGMGRVYRARHLSLERDVAIKFLLARYAPDSVTAGRFLEEARITARLQHPGIPPVHEVGTLPDGRPFLAMKLINGDTLDEHLKKRKSPAENRGRFVGVFEQIAQAVGFAHSLRIIHRDLKPANVMVGDFGEVQVMDWGLAKELRTADRGSRNEDPNATASVSFNPQSDETQAGSLLGTPAFMPPEQAIGAVEQIDERSDVFGLGAILCVILTGKPPFVADGAETTRRLAARAELDDAFARLDACGAEPELVALAKRCLAPEPADRPADAGAVAHAVAILRADAERRARQAEMDRATAEVKMAEERKRRRVQRALALAVLGLVAVAGFAGWWVESTRAARKAEEASRAADAKVRQATAERDVVAALDEALILREQGVKQSDDIPRWGLTIVAARSALQRAESLLRDAPGADGLHRRFAAMRDELDRDHRDRALLAELDRVADGNEVRLVIPISFTGLASRRYADAFRTGGIDLLSVPPAHAVAWLKGHRFRDRLVLAARGWVHVLGAANEDKAKKPSSRERLQTILREVTDDPFTREWWDAVAAGNLSALQKLVTRPELRRLSSRELASFSDGLTAFGSADVQRELMALAHDRFPGEFWVHIRLATLAGIGVGKVNDNDTANVTIRHLSAAVAARRAGALARAALGMELMRSRNDPAGLRMLKSAAEVDPASPWPHLILGMDALQKSNWDEATASFASAARADPDAAYFMLHTTVFEFYRHVPTPGGPENPPDEQIARLVEAVTAVKPNHPGSLDLLGELHLRKHDYRAALATFRKASQIAEPDYARRAVLAYELGELEKKARWEGKIPLAPDGTVAAANGAEAVEIAGYYALFEKRYARAAATAATALKADPKLFDIWLDIAKFAGWAVQAAAGSGADAADLTPAERTRLRRQALGWLRELHTRVPKTSSGIIGSYLRTLADLQPVRSAKELEKLVPEERAEWEKFWAAVAPPEPPKPPAREVAAPPRVVK